MTEARRRLIVDAATFFVLPIVIFSLSGIGFISGDAIAQVGVIQGGVRLNPNHLLLEAIGGVWMWLGTSLGSSLAGPDLLARLSIVAGALSLALFRWLIAPLLTSCRALANGGTLVLAGLSGFDRLWISGEAHMIQMPFLVLFMAGAMELFGGATPTAGRSPALITLGGVGAVLAYISNALIVTGVLVALAFIADRRIRRTLYSSLIYVGGLSLLSFALVWVIAGRQTSLVSWLTSYAGEQSTSHVVAEYGIRWSIAGFVSAGMRSVFGLLSSVVDLTPVSGFVRRGTGSLAVALMFLLACVVAIGLLAFAAQKAWRSRTKQSLGVLLCVLGMGVPILAFGAFWNNSDDQFYFQIAPALACVAIVGLRETPRLGLSLALISIPFGVNTYDLAANYVSYPRAELLTRLGGALGGATLIIAPGMDEVSHLIYYLPEAQGRVVFVSALADRLNPEEGLRVLRDTVDAVILGGGIVASVNIGSAGPSQQPWPMLSTLGYEWSAVAELMHSHTTTRRIRVSGTISVELLSGGS